VNGFQFHTKASSEGKVTYNCGMCVKGIGEGDKISQDNYGILHETIRVKFTGVSIEKYALFNFEWFDPDVPRELHYPKFIPYTEVNHNRGYKKFDHSYLLILQPKWYTLSALRRYREKQIGG